MQSDNHVCGQGEELTEMEQPVTIPFSRRFQADVTWPEETDAMKSSEMSL